MVAPKGPGSAVRRQFEAGGGLSCLVAVAQDATGSARELALAWASGIGGGRGGIMQSTFERECVTDLFGEQAVLCGGLIELMKAAVQTLIDAGYPPEMAYFECVQEVKLIVDLVYEQGIEGMRKRISTTAKYGGLTRGPQIFGEESLRAMSKVLADVESGAFARQWRQEYHAGMPLLQRLEEAEANHPAVAAGADLRAKGFAGGTAATGHG
jgi:ketol-acid reductoisomerase